MNDSLSAQLTHHWRIPPYAQTWLWVETESGCVQVEGESGLFTLPTAAEYLTIRWGGSEGSALTQLKWRSDQLHWDGAIRVGGTVEALYITQVDGIELSLAVVYLESQPLRAEFQPFPVATQRSKVPYQMPDFYQGIDDTIHPSTTIWLVAEESPLYALLHDALLNHQRVYCLGRLADEAGGWHKQFALPLLLESVMLFA